MPCGIYRFCLDNTFDIYIGQSKDIKTRLQKHITNFKRKVPGTLPIKLQNRFINTLVFDVLHICDEEYLDISEHYYIKLLQPKLNSKIAQYVHKHEGYYNLLQLLPNPVPIRHSHKLYNAYNMKSCYFE